MKVKMDSSKPLRIEVLLNPGDELDVNADLGARLLAASPKLRATKAAPKKATAKGKGPSDG